MENFLEKQTKNKTTFNHHNSNSPSILLYRPGILMAERKRACYRSQAPPMIHPEQTISRLLGRDTPLRSQYRVPAGRLSGKEEACLREKQ